MKGELGGTFDIRRRYAAVRLQQGRVQTDADWNEDTAFAIEINDGSLTIGAGAVTVAGLTARNAVDHMHYASQPFGVVEADLLVDPTVTMLLVYLDVWDRELTGVEDAGLTEPALDPTCDSTGASACWRVSLLRITPPDGTEASCDTPLREWDALGGAAEATPVVQPTYRGAGNALYRVQVSASGPAGAATFVWSRDGHEVAGPPQVIRDGWLALDDGAKIRFPAGQYRRGDFWLIPARATDDGVHDLGSPRAQHPAHHYLKLALLARDGTGSWRVLGDCRAGQQG